MIKAGLKKVGKQIRKSVNFNLGKKKKGKRRADKDKQIIKKEMKYLRPKTHQQHRRTYIAAQKPCTEYTCIYNGGDT